MSLSSIERGCSVLVNGEWYPVDGFALVHTPGKPTTGDVFTLKRRGVFEPCLGYRINYESIEAVRVALTKKVGE